MAKAVLQPIFVAQECCSVVVFLLGLEVLRFSTRVLQCVGLWVLQCSASAPCLVMLCHNVVVCCSFVLSQLCVARVFCSSVLKY